MTEKKKNVLIVTSCVLFTVAIYGLGLFTGYQLGVVDGDATIVCKIKFPEQEVIIPDIDDSKEVSSSVANLPEHD